MARTKKHEKYEVCRYCDKLYEVGFFGAGRVYCSKHCASQGYNIYQKERYHAKKLTVDRECVLCHRNILEVGNRKRVSKFCGKRCMFTHNRIMKRKDKFIMIKVPVKDFLDGNIKVNLNGKVNIGGKLIGVYDGK